MQDNLYNLAFERSILSSIIYNPVSFEELSGSLSAGDYYLPSHSAIFDAMGTLESKNQPIDEEFLKKELLKSNNFDEQVMLEILSANPISNTRAYVEEMSELSRLRKLLNITSMIKKSVVEDNASSFETITEVEKQLMLINSDTSLSMPVDMNVAIREYQEMDIPPLIKTGIRSVDSILCGGIESAQLVHVGGESGIGKTTWTKQILKNVCDIHPVLFFSFEMPRWKMAKQLEKKNFRKGNYYIIDSKETSTDVSDVVRMMRKMKHIKGIRFALIDSHIELSNNHFKGNNDVEKKADIDRQLARASNELDMVIFLITQISAENIKNGLMKSYGSTLSDYATDMKILLLKGDNSDVTLSIEKARQDVSLHVKVPLWFDKKSLEFTDTKGYETVYEYPNETYAPKKSTLPNDKIEVEII